MACIVVFCTTYAMILPAITLEQQYACGLEAHTHGGTCFDSAGNLICSEAEHTHDRACGSDPEADLESRSQWERTVSGVEITGYWDRDLLAIAKTQLGYEESVRNFQIRSDGTMAGITRYGQWYDAPYRDWNAMFVAFCLNYSQISRLAIPLDSHGGDWMNRLNELGIVASPGTDTPIPGDIAFYTGSDGKTVQIGIVSAAEAGQLRIIAGDVNDRVAELTVPESWILGICSMDAARERYAEEYPGKMPVEIPTEPATELAEDEPRMLNYIAETENYIVVVTCSSELGIPDDAVMQASEYPKESDIFRQRCEEAGYELEWLLNIGFYRGGGELEIHGDFGVQVISKRGYELGQDITHFADAGTERIDGTPVTDGTQEGQTSVAFPAPGFSDFGGGIASRAAVPNGLTLTVVDPSQLSDNCEYIIFTVVNGNYMALANNGNFSGQYIGSGGIPAVGNTITVSGGNYPQYSWLVEKLSGNNSFRLVSTANNENLHVDWNSAKRTGDHKNCSNYSISGASTVLAHPWGSGTNYLRYSNGWTGTMDQNQAAKVYYAVKNYPHAVHTGTYDVGGLRFYNFCEGKGNAVTALAGCVFEIVGTTDKGEPYTKTIVSDTNSEVVFTVPDGTYTITEISAPAGYLRDNNTRQFVVKDGKFANLQAIGLFMNHKLDALNTDKIAEVEDYNNRMYQIQLAASGYLWNYGMDPVDVLFVVDKSNSMLFPSGMKPVTHNGQEVTVKLEANSQNNVTRLNNLAAQGKLDPNQMYYLISDPNGSATAWCLWHDGETWMYQDSSYYAKAKHQNVEGYLQGDDTVVFPRDQAYTNNYGADPDGKGNLAVNGGGIGRDLGKSSLGGDVRAGNDTFVIYQAIGEYNRLHYLEEALSNMVIELAELNPQNTVTLTPFTKEVNHADCTQHPIKLDVAGVNLLLENIRNINTAGGTRQDIALQHVHEQHLGAQNSEYAGSKNFVVLITDGAPAGTSNLGDAYSKEIPKEPLTGNEGVYPMIRYWASKVKGNGDTTLMTVALGMNNVDAGRAVLKNIASGEDKYCALDDAAALVDRIQQLIFENLKPKQRVDFISDLTDVISNSFYPIAWVPRGQIPAGHQALPLKNSPDRDPSKDWFVLKSGDWITVDGRYTTQGAANAAGQLLQNADGDFYIQWKRLNLGSGWKGSFYVKAKEDFIGGNAIETNKRAEMHVSYPYNLENNADAALPSPTVNVRLLDMNRMHSEVTVYLGDLINAPGDSPLDSLKAFYENTHFIKLISDDGKVLNKPYEGDTLPKGLSDATFTLRYALGRDLTESEWSILTEGGSVTVPYTYDDPSSDGPVGYFTFRVEKQGDTANFGVHQATQSCPPEGAHAGAACAGPVETYTLHVTYTAYELDENGRPETNVHNGPAGPGREVGTGSTLETGLGTLARENVHEVHVISGRIEITKKFVSTVTTTQDQTFTFLLHRTEDGDSTVNDKTGTITIPAGTLAGSATLVFRDLPRGTYTVTEAAHPEYMVQKIRVLETTNCHSTPAPGSEDLTVTFTLGNNRSDENVIGKADTERYTAYVDAPNGVFGAAEFTNKPIVYEGEIPVKKVWDDGAENHPHDSVYLVLYRNGVPVVDEHGAARLLKLDAANNWQGSFIVALANKNDKVTNYDYSVREVSQISDTELYLWQKAVLEGTDTTVWYEKAVESGGTVGLGGKGYIVSYEAGDSASWTVTNHRGYELPDSGGMGTSHFTFGGLAMIAAALMYICITGHKRRKGGR